MASKGKNNIVMDSDQVIVPILGVLLPIIITLGAFVMIAYIRKFENLERMAIIEKGMAPDYFKKNRMTGGTLRWSFLLIGVGIGIAGNVAEQSA